MKWSSNSWDAWCEHPPGDEPPTLHVVGTCEGSPGFEFRLARAEQEAEPQPDLVLSLVVVEPRQSPRPDLREYTVSYREPGCGFDRVTIQHADEVLASVTVRQES